MESTIFIPKKIRVGYQQRHDTYTKKLAYVIYFDNKNVLRKETSWEGWRDKEIPFEDFDNLPQSGFVLNKNIERYNWSHFGSGRSYIRMYDPRGIEFEITPENLIGILMHSTCSKRGFDGEFVYAWAGKELVMLPVLSEEYQQAMNYTNRLDQKVPAKELKLGCSYTTKKDGEVIYIGRFNWWEWDSYTDGRKCKKKHIFYAKDNFFPKNDTSSLASLNNPEPVSNYADLIDQFKNKFESSNVVRWESTPVIPDITSTEDQWNRKYLKKSTYYWMNNDEIRQYLLIRAEEWDQQNKKNIFKGFQLKHIYSLNKKSWIRSSHNSYYDNWYNKYEKTLSEEEVLKELSKMVDIYMILENGSKKLFGGM